MTYEEAINTIKHGCIYQDKKGNEALEVAVIVLEKQIPKKPILNIIYPSGIKSYNCPICKKGCLVKTALYCPKYCSDCGQALDWSGLNEL